MDIKRLFKYPGEPIELVNFLRGQRVCGAFVLVALVGFLVVASGCVETTEAASGLSRGQNVNLAAAAKERQESLAQLVAQGNTVLHFDPSPAQVTVGGTVAVQIRLENVQNLYGIEVHLAFDKSVLQVEDQDPGQDGVQIAPGVLPYPDFSVQNMVDNFGGRLDYAVVQLSPRPAASGSGVVATIRFRGVQAGTSSIHFTHAKLASPDGFAIPATLQDGTLVVVEPGAPTPTPGPTHTPGPTATPGPTDTPGPTATPAPPTPTPPPGATATPPPVTGCAATYLVRTGDTAYSIARRFNISLSDLAAANNLSAAFSVRVGQLLTIPGVAGSPSQVHTVQAGETLYAISRRYGSTVETLAAINQIPYPWHVRTGQRLWICPP